MWVRVCLPCWCLLFSILLCFVAPCSKLWRCFHCVRFTVMIRFVCLSDSPEEEADRSVIYTTKMSALWYTYTRTLSSFPFTTFKSILSTSSLYLRLHLQDVKFCAFILYLFARCWLLVVLDVVVVYFFLVSHKTLSVHLACCVSEEWIQNRCDTPI